MMTIPEIVKALTEITGEFPREALLEAMEQREEIIPELLRIIEHDTDHLADIVTDPDYMGHMYAMYLLAQFREPRAYPLLVKLVSSDFGMIDEALGETITDGLDQILASTFDGNIILLQQMIEDSTLDDYIRGMAMDVLVILVAQWVLSREEVLCYFASLFREKFEREHSKLWTFLVGSCCELYPEEVSADIAQAFADELIDSSVFDTEARVKETVAEGKEHVLAELANDPRRCFIEDTIKEMEYWCFSSTPGDSVSDMSPEFEFELAPEPLPVITPEKSVPKVGRNELFPCGSGKKYKRCCGA